MKVFRKKKNIKKKKERKENEKDGDKTVKCTSEHHH